MSPRIRRWVRGGKAAFISGGAHAIAPTGVTTLMDPDHFNPLASWHGVLRFLLLGLATFVFSGGYKWFRWLEDNPLPPESTGDTDHWNRNVSPVIRSDDDTTFGI